MAIQTRKDTKSTILDAAELLMAEHGINGVSLRAILAEADANSAAGGYAFWLGIAAALLTAFYSGRLLFMTFHGQPRADEKVMAHVHESPKVMLIPLLILAAGAAFAGYVGFDAFVGAGAAEFWDGAIFVLPSHTALEAAHQAPLWVKYLPLGVGLAGIAGPTCSTSAPPSCRGFWPGASGRFICSCSTSGTSTNFTTFCSCARPSCWAGASGSPATGP